MGDEIKAKFILIAITALLITGCTASTPESKPEYDEVELMVYQICIDKVIDSKMKIKPDWSFVSFLDVQRAKEDCAELKPTKQ